VTDDSPDEGDGLGMTHELARLQLCLATTRDRDVEQEDRKHGCNRQRDDEPDGTRVPGHAVILKTEGS
jgi:hypothetical protein